MCRTGAKAKAADLLRESFGWGLWGFAAFALLAGLSCYLILGPQAFAAALDDDLAMVARTLPRIVLALNVALAAGGLAVTGMLLVYPLLERLPRLLH